MRNREQPLLQSLDSSSKITVLAFLCRIKNLTGLKPRASL